ncbi:MAG: DEAD/DEAH box helicase [Actinobacteria bacterium]|nr:DEAD/DEAH box helicase [Actinomycetota bacterium]
MASERRPPDWVRDLNSGRDAEEYVRALLFGHPAVRRVADLSTQPETPDFEFQYEGERVGLEVKAKLQRYSARYREMWPELAERDLFILDEGSLRALSWAEGMGYLLIADAPSERWIVIGPWELLLGPRRRYQRLDDGKGKLLLDLGTGQSMDDVVVDEVLRIVRRTRATRREVRPIRLRGQAELPVVPKAPAPVDSEPVPRPPRVTQPNEPKPQPVVEHLDLQPGAERVLEPSTVGRLPAVWCGLSGELGSAVEAAYGWREPTEVQKAAIPPVLAGHNTLVLAPTAGGKTEAALLPLLDVGRREGWNPTSILAVSPMKALLDDQLRRYQSIAALTGATAFAWHGDTPKMQRRQFLDHPSDILLTTPESLEILLHRIDAKEMLRGIQAVILDEVHVFVGTARGAQLAAVLERLEERCDADLQRVGLSATVGTPDDVLAWLGGSSYRERSLAGVAAAATREETNIVSYEHETQLTSTLSAVLGEQRSLVFVQSRRRAEHLGGVLDVPVHHSSLSPEGRRAAINRFQAGEVAGIVATATLELGIDIGDVELVVQDGSPSGPASYLQRVGRSGRRTGMRRMLFTCGTPDDLLQVLAVLARVRRGALEPLPVQRGGRLMLGQQALALALDPVRTGFERHELASTICYSPVFRGLQDDALATLEHLVENEWLRDVRGLLVAGHRANLEFGGGGRNFAKLAASFDTRASVPVVTEDGTHVGTIDWTAAQDDKWVGRGEPFRLGGRGWSAVDVNAEVVRVVPAAVGAAAKPPSWRGPSLDVDRATWETAREILENTDVPAAIDERGELWLEILRAQWRPRLAKPLWEAERETTLITFAGAAVHRSVLALLNADGAGDGPELRITAPDCSTLRTRAREALGDLAAGLDGEAARVAAAIGGAHRDLVPASVLEAEAAEFWVDADAIRKVLTMLVED